MKRFDVILWLAVLLATLVGLSEIRARWDQIAALTSEQKAILGAVGAAFLGLVGFLGRAFYNAKLNRDRDDRNAKLNRDRDDRLRIIERRALLEALVAELELFGNLLLAHANRAANMQESMRDAPPDAMARVRESLLFPQPKIYEANFTRLELIGARLIGTMEHAYAVVADTGVFIANIQDERVWDALGNIAERCSDNRLLIVITQRVLMAEIDAMGGLTGTHISAEKMAAIVAEVETEFASGDDAHTSPRAR